MNHFVERLPWRIAALAGLLVGGISLLTGADFWTTLLRVSAAFAVFGAAGLALSVFLRSSSAPAVQGRHFDQTLSDPAVPKDSTEEPAAPTSNQAGDPHK